MKKICALTICLVILFLVAIDAIPVNAQTSTITIDGNGNIDPQVTAIQRDGNTYTLNADLKNTPIVVEANNIILDGAGHTVKGSDSRNAQIALNLTAANVAVRNLQIQSWEVGILGAWNNNTIVNNTLNDNNKGIAIYGNDYVIRQNTVNGSSTALFIDGGKIRPHGDNNLIINNRITRSTIALDILTSDGTTVKENEIANNDCILFLATDTENTLFLGNNFVNNRKILTIPFGGPFVEGAPTFSPAGQWDNGTAGNYWSDYQTIYPNASEVDHKGTGNIPYEIACTLPYTTQKEDGSILAQGVATLGTAVDNHPLMAPVEIPFSYGGQPSPSPSVPEFSALILLVIGLLVVYGFVLVAVRYPSFFTKRLKRGINSK
ncbi:MAG: NosD domain-containing protein [Candidatus Bathyarchaeia archaeon]